MKHSPYKLYFYTAGTLIILFAGFVFYYSNKFLSSDVDLIQKIILSYFLAINLTTLFLYLWDKVNSARREKTLGYKVNSARRENTLGYKVNSARRENALGHKIIASSKKATRVPELVFHTLALLGGSPTALISQKLFRHKTSKKKFQIIYWLIVLVQVAIFFWWINKKIE